MTTRGRKHIKQFNDLGDNIQPQTQLKGEKKFIANPEIHGGEKFRVRPALIRCIQTLTQGSVVGHRARVSAIL
jgi:hypothetical protein